MLFFSKWVDKIQAIFAPRSTTTVEAVAVEVAAVEAKATLELVVVDNTKAKTSKKAGPKVELVGKRTRKSGKFVADDKSTPNVNEAYTDGKTPAKKPTTKKKSTMKIAK